MNKGQISTATGFVLLLIVIALLLGVYGTRIGTTGDTLNEILLENLRTALGKETTCAKGEYAGYTRGSFAEAFVKITASDPKQAGKLLDLYAGLDACFGIPEELWTPGFMGGEKVEPMKMVLQSAQASLKEPVNLKNAVALKTLAERFQKALSPEQFTTYHSLIARANSFLACERVLLRLDSLLESKKAADLAELYGTLNDPQGICWSTAVDEISLREQKFNEVLQKDYPQCVPVTSECFFFPTRYPPSP